MISLSLFRVGTKKNKENIFHCPNTTAIFRFHIVSPFCSDWFEYHAGCMRSTAARRHSCLFSSQPPALQSPPQRETPPQKVDGSRQRAALTTSPPSRRVQLKAVSLNFRLFNCRPSRSAQARVYVRLHMGTSASGQFILPYAHLCTNRTVRTVRPVRPVRTTVDRNSCRL